MSLSSPFTYFGNKKRELKIIEQYQPNTFDKVYDLYGGSSIVSMHYTRLGKEVYYNDIDASLVSLLKTIFDPTTKLQLLNEYDQIPKTKDEYLKLNKAYIKDSRALSHAHTLFLRFHAFRGILRAGVPATDSKGVLKSDLNLVNRIKNTDYPIFSMSVGDALEIIEEIKDDSMAFVYLDPPYLSQGVSCAPYAHTNLQDIENIISIIKDPVNYKCKIMFHVGFEGYIYYHLKDYIKYIYPHSFSCAKVAGRKYYKKYQCIICNY